MDSLDRPTKSPPTGQRRGAVLVIENRGLVGDGPYSCLVSQAADAATFVRGWA